MTHKNEKDIYIRPAALGDICVLLEPAQEVEIERLSKYQLALQSSFGGTPVEPIHLTCQRFANEDGQQLKHFQNNLTGMLASMEPFALTALSLDTLYVPILKSNILKWQIEVTDELQQLVALVEQALVGVGVNPLYKTGFVSSLVAALRGVPKMDEDKLVNYGGFPHPLYTVERIVLSQICGSNEFKLLATIPLGSRIDSAS